MPTVMWFRRDLRLADNPALSAAVRDSDAADGVVPLFVLDDALLGPSGPNRVAYLYRSLRALDESLNGRLVVMRGDPVEVVPRVAAEVEATSVYVTADFGPYGSERDARVDAALDDAGRVLQPVSSPYAVAPGTVLNGSGDPYKVFTPFSKAWRAVGWPKPDRAPSNPVWLTGVKGVGIPRDPTTDASLPDAGEDAAKRAARRFWDTDLDGYDTARDRPDRDASSRLSPFLKYGTIHPRQLLAMLDETKKSHATYAKELCWREFYADVLFHQPDSARVTLQPKMRNLRWSTGAEADRHFDAWVKGMTGYPIVDAGMRQLLAEGWMHNRVRMITASFLVKDLHIDWTRGAAHFMKHLVDGDIASNQHGWQWTAGTGTDAAPFFRVFNPALQEARFDPEGEYVRRWVPELRENGHGYPEPIVDHAEERDEALRRYQNLSD